MARLERLESLVKNREERSRASNALSELERRLSALEQHFTEEKSDEAQAAETAPDGKPMQYCALPPTPPRVFDASVSPERARLILLSSRKWVNGTKLRYCFMDEGSSSSNSEQKDMVRQGFEEWKEVEIGLTFEEVRDRGSAEIRIGFVQGDGAWSYIGRDSIDVAGQNERSMNFGWDLRTDPRRVDVAVHEIGHALGFPHEHQNPFAGIVWDEEAVYRYFGGPPNNWPRNVTEFNILEKLSQSEVQGSEWDPDSIMHYAFPAGLIREPAKYRSGLSPAGGLSGRDTAQAKLFYPPLAADFSELVPFRSQPLRLAPAEQANFTIKPTATRNYTIQTFGGSDTVIVLFEDVNGELRYVKGDDDSGMDRNARIALRLFAGKRYVLRLRMYYSFDSGEISVMMW